MIKKRNDPDKHKRRARLKWAEFEGWIRGKHLWVFTPLDVERNFGATRMVTLNFLRRHAKEGRLAKVKPSLYTLVDQPAPDLYLANKLYEPSYISLEFALSFHRVKPETVYTVTSVTTKKTKVFEALGYVFPYHHIKKKAFTGYKALPYRGVTILMADPEKALVDHLYLGILSGESPPVIVARVFERLKREKIDKAKALRYTKLFNDNRLVTLLEEYL